MRRIRGAAPARVGEPPGAPPRLSDMGIANGVFNRNDLARMGVSNAELRRHLRDGALIRLRRGWYARACAHDTTAVERVRELSCWRSWQACDSRRLADGG